MKKTKLQPSRDFWREREMQTGMSVYEIMLTNIVAPSITKLLTEPSPLHELFNRKGDNDGKD